MLRISPDLELSEKNKLKSFIHGVNVVLLLNTFKAHAAWSSKHLLCGSISCKIQLFLISAIRTMLFYISLEKNIFANFFLH